MASECNKASASEALSECELEEGDYESDSEETSALALRRREASDDEEEDGHQLDGMPLDAPSSGEESRSRPVFSDDEVDDEGAPPDDEEEEDYGDVSRSVVVIGRRTNGIDEEDADEGRVVDVTTLDKEDLEQSSAEQGHGGTTIGGVSGSKDGATEEKKDTEPFVVPTAGAFYMHDDRFRDNGGTRPRYASSAMHRTFRRSPGGRKLWEAKDEKPWVHDRFEELNLHDESFAGKESHGQAGRGRLRGRGRGRGRGRIPRYSRGKGGSDRGSEDIGMPFSWHGVGRKQGARRSTIDDDIVKDSSVAASKLNARVSEEIATSSRSSPQSAVKLPEPVQSSTKAVNNSTLNSASPAFYPSGAFQHNISAQAGSPKRSQGVHDQQKGRGKETQQGGRLGMTVNNTLSQGITSSNPVFTLTQPSIVGHSSNPMLVVDAARIDSITHTRLDKGQSIVRQQLLKTGSGSMQQKQLSKADGKTQPSVEQPVLVGALQQTGRGQLLPSLNGLRMQQPPALKQGQHLEHVSQTLSVNVPAVSSLATDVTEVPSSPGNQSINAGIGRGGRGSSVQVGRGSFGYSNAAGLTSGLWSGEPSFPSPSAVLPIVQFGGRPQAGLGVPSVGVALPAYSGQPQFGFGNSEVTWVPILAGGGAMGPGYSSPYITVDGAPPAVYYTQPTAQPANFTVPGRDLNGAKPAGGIWKPPSRPEFGNEDFVQRQSKPRRYSEMNFGQ